MTESKMEIYVQSSIPYQVRTRVYQGKKQIIVPVVMMVEGVHSGSHGPILHPASELGRFPAAWNGIPVMIGHPVVDGMNVSANSPEVLEQSVGRVFNTHMDDSKLRADVWIEEEKISTLSPTALSYIREGKPLEVSIGAFTDEEVEAGTYTKTDGEVEQYNAIARNHRPDHLALLPGEQGACGWDDGCGIRANSLNINSNEEEKDMTDPILVMKQMAQENILLTITDNKQGYQELMGKISNKLDAMDDEDSYHMLEEVYDDSVVYRKRSKKDGETGFYQQPFQVNADDSIELVGDPKRVRRSVSYVQVNEMRRTIFYKKGEPTMSKPCCEEKVTALINNSLTSYTEADREWLLELGAEKLEKMVPKEPEAPQVNADMILKSSIKTAEDAIALAPVEIQEALKTGLTLHEAHRNELIQSVLTNSAKDAWTEDELKAQDTVMLEKLNKQFVAPVDYSVQGAGKSINVNGEKTTASLLPPGVE